MDTLIGGGGSPFGLTSVTLAPDPTLMSADPAAMQIVSQQFASAAREMYQIFQTTSTASGTLLHTWHGKAAHSFYETAQQQDINAQAAADALIGVSGALKTLATSISAAQDKVRKAQALASTTNESINALNNAYDKSSAAAFEALPANASEEDFAAAARPTYHQDAEAEALSADIKRADHMVAEANEEAQKAWKKAAADFDAVTSQSPTVQLELLTARMNAFNKKMDQAGIEAIAMMIAGSLNPEMPEGDDEDDVIVPLDDPAIAKMIDEEGLEDGQNLHVDGDKLDEAIAVDGNSEIIDDVEKAEQAALGDPEGGTVIQNPGKPLSAEDYPYLEPKPTDDSIGATPGKMPNSEPVTVADAPPGWPELKAKDIDTFQGKVEPTAAVGGVTYYRVVGEDNYPGGSFWSTTPPTESTRSDLAIKGSWNSITGVVEFTPAAGETIPAWHGATAPQAVTMPDGTPGHFPGGADQIWVPQNAFNNSNGTFTIHKFGN